MTEQTIPLYNGQGFVSLIEVMGSDVAIEAAARLSYGKGTQQRTKSDTRSLIRYLVRHRHTSPIEQGVLRFHMKIPIFVMRQHVRHRTASMNEYSGRYSEMMDDMYVPEIAAIELQSTENKQGGMSGIDTVDQMAARGIIQEANSVAQRKYQYLLEMGVSREQARMVLPVSNFTEAVWQINLHNFLHYATLRTDSHAQKEIRDLANAMGMLAEPHFPLVMEAWRDYQKNSKTLSAMEQRLLVDCMSPGCSIYDTYGSTKEWDKYGMTQREWKEFFDWLSADIHKL